MARASADLADLDVVDILAAAWRKHAALRAAARSTLAAPGTRQVVDLATHRVTSAHRPYVELLVDGAPAGKVDFEIHLELVVKGLSATVSNGNLTALHGGRCELLASLACEGIPLVKRQGDLDLELVLHLDQELPLLPRHRTGL